MHIVPKFFSVNFTLILEPYDFFGDNISLAFLLF